MPELCSTGRKKTPKSAAWQSCRNVDSVINGDCSQWQREGSCLRRPGYLCISNVFILLVRGHLYMCYDNGDDISSLLISLWLAIHHSWNITKIMVFFLWQAFANIKVHAHYGIEATSSTNRRKAAKWQAHGRATGQKQESQFSQAGRCFVLSKWRHKKASVKALHWDTKASSHANPGWCQLNFVPSRQCAGTPGQNCPRPVKQTPPSCSKDSNFLGLPERWNIYRLCSK